MLANMHFWHATAGQRHATAAAAAAAATAGKLLSPQGIAPPRAPVPFRLPSGASQEN